MSNISEYVGLEQIVLLLTTFIVLKAIQRLILNKISAERHENLRGLFKDAFRHLLGVLILFGIFTLGQESVQEGWIRAAGFTWAVQTGVQRSTNYLGLATLVLGLIVLVKLTRIATFEYLFFRHQKVPVPLLLVNLATFSLFIFLCFWLLSAVFNIKLGPLLATSALLSVVLGLALQETLTNLVAGLALQIDKPYDLGDWVEVTSDGSKWLGQVYEMSWRSTVLVGIQDELITIPNRVMGQAQVINYSFRSVPILRSILFRLPLDCDFNRATEALIQVAKKDEGVAKFPEVSLILTETTPSWATAKLIFPIRDFSHQYRIIDRMIRNCLDALRAQKISLASERLEASVTQR